MAVSNSKRTVDSQHRPATLLLIAVDLIIAAFVFVLPFIMGGREAWGHWFVISGALLLGVVWATYATISGSRYFCVVAGSVFAVWPGDRLFSSSHTIARSNGAVLRRVPATSSDVVGDSS